MSKTHSVRINLTLDQLQGLIQHAEEEKEYWLTFGNEEDMREWSRVRDELAYHLDMISNYPFEDKKG